jgi:hypothetical protein
MSTQHNKDFAIPENLDDAGIVAVDTITALLDQLGMDDTGGCKAFYSPTEWKERGEEYGKDSVLIVVHDGGDLACFFNWSYAKETGYRMLNDMQEALEGEGLRAEQCTAWYTAIYNDAD